MRRSVSGSERCIYAAGGALEGICRASLPSRPKPFLFTLPAPSSILARHGSDRRSRMFDELKKTLTVAWISDFPIEWLPDLPAPLRHLPRRHPATWEMVLLDEFEKDSNLRIHVIVLRHRLERDFSFERNGTTYHLLKAPVWLRVGSLFWLDTLLIGRVCRRIKPHL